MKRYDPQRHHRRSIRMKDYDYATEGAYFVTLLCHKRSHLFGEIRNGIMCLSNLGAVAYNEWLHTAEIRTNVCLEAFVILPNHMHAILTITHRSDRRYAQGIGSGTEGTCDKGVCDKGVCDKGTCDRGVCDKGVCDTPLLPMRSPSQTVGAMVRGYKGAVTHAAGDMGITDPVWQRNYHEHIIRNAASFERIAAYIDDNILNWKTDGFY